MNYYNDNDPRSAEWLRELIRDGIIPPGTVDERSISDVKADDLRGFRQCHFFAGCGGWPIALRLAGWQDDRPVWTGSCPCQPYSSAGKRKGKKDERDLWPEFYRLIAECRPAIIFGEQVASSDVIGTAKPKTRRELEKELEQVWLDRISADLETAYYARGATVVGAHSICSPHRRLRLYWGAVDCRLSDDTCQQAISQNKGGFFPGIAANSNIGGMGENTERLGRTGRDNGSKAGNHREIQAPGLCDDSGLDDAECRQYKGQLSEHGTYSEEEGERETTEFAGHMSFSGLGNLPGNDELRNSVPGENGERLPAGRSGGDDKRVEHMFAAGSQGKDTSGNENNSRRNNTEIWTTTPRSDLSDISPWADGVFVLCRDRDKQGRYKIRRVPSQSVFFGVADGLSAGCNQGGNPGVPEPESGFPLCEKEAVDGRVVLLKGMGNAIVPQLAAEFIRAFELIKDTI